MGFLSAGSAALRTLIIFWYGDEDALQFEINGLVDEVIISPLGCIFILHHFWELFQYFSMQFAF